MFGAVSSLPGKRWAPTAASLPGGRALIAGGSDGSDELKTALIFDPATNSFGSTGISDLGTKRQEAAGVELADGRVLVAGGYDGGVLQTAEVLSVPSNAFRAKLKGRKVKFTVTNEGVAGVTDVSTKVATTANKKKKKPKLVRTTSKHGGPGTVVVKVKLTKLGTTRLRQKGKVKIRLTYTPDGGLAASKKLALRAGK
jgi:hypothetical protein